MSIGSQNFDETYFNNYLVAKKEKGTTVWGRRLSISWSDGHSGIYKPVEVIIALPKAPIRKRYGTGKDDKDVVFPLKLDNTHMLVEEFNPEELEYAGNGYYKIKSASSGSVSNTEGTV